MAEAGEVSGLPGGDGLPPVDSDPAAKAKNNNGYGNGPEAGLAPGHSGAALPGADQNVRPRGDR